MKTTKRCPKCSGTRIAMIEGIYDNWSIALPPEIAARLGIGTKKAEPGAPGYRDPAAAPPPVPRATSQSELERTAYVCAACGFYETYVSRPETLEEDGAQGGLRWWN